MEKIKEIEQFSKLFKINIPTQEHFEYYIKTLMKSEEFSGLDSLISEYANFEEWVKFKRYQNVGEYKMGHALKEIKNYLSKTRAYEKCQLFDYSKEKFYQKNHLKMHEGNFLLSLDISSANFQSLKAFDADNELKENWEELCSELLIHPTLAKSKSFRQIVFGNLNPKRFQKIQHMCSIKLAEFLMHIVEKENVIVISHDEIILNLGKEIVLEKIESILSHQELFKENLITSGEVHMDFKHSIFKMEKISKDVYVKIFPKLDFNKPPIKTLWGCPKNLFYINFKKHILEEEIDERDCLFELEGKLAKWII